jgi:type IV pilus assembly protein PilX
LIVFRNFNMQTLAQLPKATGMTRACRFGKALPVPRNQSGVVLIIALILLVVISLLAITSMRGAGSAEKVAGNVRTTELATQAAEMALRHCESSAIQLARNTPNTDPNFYATTFPIGSIAPVNSVQWQSTTTWDSTTANTATFVLPASTFVVGGTSTYKRPPECMVELLSGGMPTGAASVTPSAFVITARGFGPEVATGAGRPQGSEIWLQSTIEIQ